MRIVPSLRSCAASSIVGSSLICMCVPRELVAAMIPNVDRTNKRAGDRRLSPDYVHWKHRQPSSLIVALMMYLFDRGSRLFRKGQR